uniref:Uncharacterized protein n=1 Tax=Anguilla anguilla TaxID=7936 RepID=A0A0E9Q0I9_ANGAN
MAYLLPGLIGLLKPFVTLACLYSPCCKGNQTTPLYQTL